MSEIAFDMELNCQGLNCPLPILKTKKTVDAMKSGEVLKITATDPGSVNDMPSWARRTGNELIGQNEADGIHTFYVRKK
ncbi:MAG: sulfurtransferase TusA family protein [Chlorobiaceae bacterium]|jgi:tRNA 2-thiouridine synthesizing protein A|nr:sulfurtransferase TusA family protein [Chlorobiaceae bacterium]